jgi:hypothetical protein
MRPMLVCSIGALENTGLDVEWLASDAEGYVALFSSRGGAIPPDAVLQDLDTHLRAIEALLAGPVLTRPLFAPPAPANDHWRAMTERGLFVYHCAPGGGAYRLAAAPEIPIRALELPEIAGLLVEALRFDQLRFRHVHSVTPDVLLAYCPTTVITPPFIE